MYYIVQSKGYFLVLVIIASRILVNIGLEPSSMRPVGFEPFYKVGPVNFVI